MAEQRKVPVVAILVMVVAAIALTVMIVTTKPSNNSDDSAATIHESNEAEMPDIARRDANDPLALGDVDAPVVMVEFSEFQCPFCGKFARETTPELVSQFVDKGVLRMEFRDFPYLGDESTFASKAARAAGEQGKFWDFHREIFANQLPTNSGNLDDAYVENIAKKIDLDIEKFRTDLTSEATAQAIQKDRDEGLQLGVTGTPAFIINGRLVVGAQPTEVFIQVIEEAAEAAGA